MATPQNPNSTVNGKTRTHADRHADLTWFVKATAAALIISSLAIAPAAAQSNEAKVIVVNANFQLSIPIEASATTADMAKALAQAYDALTGLAERQCGQMAASFKRECRVAQRNLSANLNESQQFNEANPARRVADANMNLRMELLPPADAAAAPRRRIAASMRGRRWRRRGGP